MNTPVCAMTSLLRHPGQGLVGYDTSNTWHGLPSHQTVVKTEPLSLDQDHHSPINDSGISQDHGSSGPGSSSSGPSPPTLVSRSAFNSSPHSPGFDHRLSPSHPDLNLPHLPPQQYHQVMLQDRSSPHTLTPQRLSPNPVNGIIRIKSPNHVLNVPAMGRPSYGMLSSHMQGLYASPLPPRLVSHDHFSPPAGPDSETGSIPRRPSPLAAIPTPTDDNNSRSSASSASDGDGYYHDKMAADSGYYPDKMAAGHGQEGALKSLQAALERSGPLCPEKDDGDEGDKMQCPLCAYSTTSRPQFHAHLGTHYEHKCTLCDFTAQGVDTLRVHMRDEHDQLLSPDTEPETGDNENEGSMDGDEPGVRIPRVNSQGKVKTFRCKQCDFVSVTKLVFWEHSRTHIKLEKLLTCPKCPFVTEYKHHLEYHLRNHFGSKPFKCDKCSYSCVNKSMLNSHLKSHSNVYQYRCADCNYATKYCHSLKLHLRKYTHKPAMVLNPDGSPNPLPIIDVYGTRRGPKLKPKEEDLPPTMIPNQFSMYQSHFMVPTSQSQMVPFPYGPLMNAFPHNPPFPAFPHHQAQEKGPEKASMERIMSFVNNNNNNAPEGLKDFMTKVISEDSILDVVGGVEEKVAEHEDERNEANEDEGKMEGDMGAGTPLDLSRSEPEVTVTPMIGSKNRRKGKAFKLERLAMKLQHQPDEEEEEKEADMFPPKKVARIETEEVTVEPPKAPTPEPKRTTPVESAEAKVDEEKPKVEVEVYNCQFCDIAFRDIVMYTMHMGYHGFQDPFKCNMCGQQTSDKVSFFLHIARTSHC